MLALTLGDDARSLHLVTVQAPEATRPDDVIVRILQSGICGTDRSVLVGKFDARPGVIMGHEAVGIVEGTGDWVTNVKPGDRVVVNPTLFCGECLECRKGRFNHCVNKANNEIGIDRDGTFCEQIVLPAQFVVPVPDEISTDRATLIEPFCCALSNVTAAGVQPGSRVIILGGGPVGALASIAAALSGGQVTLVEANPH
ncbi:alcohol dehydrogenase catalytic domain-containing protein [Cutibacterium acnes]|nr:alcohol dehydrogenase catalytic domain-containing protein [Cutibacterium acnes]